MRDVAACELSDEQRRGPAVHMEAVLVGLGGHRRQPASEAICGLGQERVSQPGIGVVDQDLDRPQRGLGAIEQLRNSRWVRPDPLPTRLPDHLLP